MNLKPQDLLVVLKLVSSGSAPYGTLAHQLGMSASEVHAAVKRAASAGLLDTTDPENRRVQTRALYQFLIHGVPRVFPAKPGPIVHGTPTAHAAPPLSSIIASQDDLLPVWPDPDGKTRGYELRPLYKAAPGAARRDPVLHELLALVDAIRSGRARERSAADLELRRRLLTAPEMRQQVGPFGITENDLDRWSDLQTGSEYILPDLIRRLVFFLVPREKLVEAPWFPSHKSANQPGFDGELKTRAPTLFANTEAAVWEISSRKDIQKKANEDFALRTGDPMGWDKKATTYIAVTSRIWRKGRSAWLQKKREEGEWADVRAYDATNIVGWLQQAPAVHAWFSSQIGRPLDDLDTLDSYFTRWSGRTAPDIDEKIALAGRDQECQKLRDWLHGNPSTIVAWADTIEESVVLFCASVLSSNEPEKNNWLSRTVIVRSEQAWQQFLNTSISDPGSPLVLVPAFSSFDGATAGIEAHFLFVPREKGQEWHYASHQLDLRPMDRDSLAEALRDVIPHADEARMLAYNCGGKLTILQRRLGYRPSAPDWIGKGNPDFLAALLLAGAWDPNNAADTQILVRLAGATGYSGIEKLTKNLFSVPDPPLRTQGQVIKWRSRLDAWERLTGKLSPSVINRFRETCIEVLGKASPRFDLPPEKRFYAKARNAELLESEAIREGLAESLAYLRMRADNVLQPLLETDVIAAVDDGISGVLRGDWKNWATLNQQLPALAEASPSLFLSVVENTLDDRPQVFEDLFQQDNPGAGLFGACCHTGLLWSLEGLAWYGKYFSSAVRILARFCHLDLQCRPLNCPMESLKRLFHPLVKQTACFNDRRIPVLQELCKNEEGRAVAWMVVCHVLSIFFQGTAVSSNYRPRFCGDVLPEPLDQYPPLEIVDFLKEIKALARDLISDYPERLLELFATGGATVIIEDVFKHIEDHASKLRQRNPELLVKLQNSLRKWVSQQFADGAGEDSVPPRVEKARQLIESLDSENSALRAAWLFEQPIFLPDPVERDSDWRKKERRIQEMRSEAISRLLDEPDGFDRVMALADIAGDAGIVGSTLAALPGTEIHDESIIRGPLALVGARKQAAMAYLSRRTKDMGCPWLINLVDRLKNEKREDAAVDAVLAVESVPEIRDWVESQTDQIKRSYWNQVLLWHPAVRDDAEFTRIVTYLLSLHRWKEAIYLAEWALDQDKKIGTTEDYFRILEHPLCDCPEDKIKEGLNHPFSSYAIPRTFAHLDRCKNVTSERLAELEVFYLDLLEHSEYEVKHIMQKLEQSPSFFADLVAAIYPPASESENLTDMPEEEKKKREGKAYFAYRILRAWKGYPGIALPPDERDESLKQWCDQALELVKGSDRYIAGQHQIGEMLCRVPSPAEDSVWPCRVARDYLNLGYKEIGSGLEQARFNSFGTSFRSPGEGGKQESEIAITYQADADKIRDTYPRIAALLDRMARSYQDLAEYQDKKAEEFTDP